MRGISLQTVQLLASQQGYSFMELINVNET